MKLVYFAWIRERIGVPEEDVELPAEVATTTDLVAWLKTRGPGYEHALEDAAALRIAVDHVHAPRETALAGVREVALFPPMTGG